MQTPSQFCVQINTFGSVCDKTLSFFCLQLGIYVFPSVSTHRKIIEVAWQLKWTNVSSKFLYLTDLNHSEDIAVQGIVHQPARSIDTGGSDYVEIDQGMLSFAASGYVNFYQGIYSDTSQNTVLWIWVSAPLQVLGMGYSPLWYHRLIVGGPDPEITSENGWNRHDTEVVDVRLWDVKATISPTKHHSDILVDVVIDDAP